MTEYQKKVLHDNKERNKIGFIPFFDCYSQCPNFVLHRYLFAETVMKGLDVYNKADKRWHLLEYNKFYFVIGFGNSSIKPKIDIKVENEINYKNIGDFDCILIKYPQKRTILNASKIFQNIIKDLNAGLK